MPLKYNSKKRQFKDESDESSESETDCSDSDSECSSISSDGSRSDGDGKSRKTKRVRAKEKPVVKDDAPVSTDSQRDLSRLHGAVASGVGLPGSPAIDSACLLVCERIQRQLEAIEEKVIYLEKYINAVL